MHIVIDSNDYMTRVEQAIRANFGSRKIQVIGVLPRDQSEREGYWERRYIAAFERVDGLRGTADFGTVMVLINSNDEFDTVQGNYGMANSTAALDDMIDRAGMSETPNNRETVIQLVINEASFEGEVGEPFTDDFLIKFGKDANEAACSMGGYEGWRARRDGRYVFDPEETRTGA